MAPERQTRAVVEFLAAFDDEDPDADRKVPKENNRAAVVSNAIRTLHRGVTEERRLPRKYPQ
jgi:hypothetical protein